MTKNASMVTKTQVDTRPIDVDDVRSSTLDIFLFNRADILSFGTVNVFFILLFISSTTAASLIFRKFGRFLQMLQLHRHGMFQNRPVDGYVILTPHLFRGDKIGSSGCVDCLNPDDVVGELVDCPVGEDTGGAVVGTYVNDSVTDAVDEGTGEVVWTIAIAVVSDCSVDVDSATDALVVAADDNEEVIGSVAGAVVGEAIVAGTVNDDIVDDSLSELLVLRFPDGAVVSVQYSVTKGDERDSVMDVS
ncbi:hypothetical protein SNE40_010861 [Patella caerulea]|uniref:Uncharacterized protein n=1 Tax=Patella caerulea TaxID=87958 RepID=A0AAN8JR66_PATCE